MERIGVIGLGRMGSALARRLLGQGRSVTGWTRSGRRVEGVTSAPDLEALVAVSDTLILSLFDDAAVTQMLDELLACDLQGKLILETSTVVPDILKSRQAAFAQKGALVADAPISGGPEMVEAGTCGIFLGAEGNVAERAKPVLGQITPRVLHMGPLGAGMAMKTINNSLLQVYFVALQQMVALAKRAGISLEDAMTALNGGPAAVPMVQSRTPKILGQDETVGFTVNGIHKDCHVFRRVVESHGLDASALALAEAAQITAIEGGLGEADQAAMIAAAYHDA